LLGVEIEGREVRRLAQVAYLGSGAAALQPCLSGAQILLCPMLRCPQPQGRLLVFFGVLQSIIYLLWSETHNTMSTILTTPRYPVLYAHSQCCTPIAFISRARSLPI
jgi:hypothetical protein